MPVVLGGNMLDQYVASFKNSDLFKHFVTRRLKTNHRLNPGQNAYRKWLKQIGTGVANERGDYIQLQPTAIVRTEEELIRCTFPQELLDDPLNNWEELSGRAILCPSNKETFLMNQQILVIIR